MIGRAVKVSLDTRAGVERRLDEHERRLSEIEKRQPH
jgi:hypothetical protein